MLSWKIQHVKPLSAWHCKYFHSSLLLSSAHSQRPSISSSKTSLQRRHNEKCQLQATKCATDRPSARIDYYSQLVVVTTFSHLQLNFLFPGWARCSFYCKSRWVQWILQHSFIAHARTKCKWTTRYMWKDWQTIAMNLGLCVMTSLNLLFYDVLMKIDFHFLEYREFTFLLCATLNFFLFSVSPKVNEKKGKRKSERVWNYIDIYAVVVHRLDKKIEKSSQFSFMQKIRWLTMWATVEKVQN